MKMIDQPLISVIISTFNRAYCIERAINSVINQTYLSWELIIIDDGSTDATYEIILPYLADPRIKYIHQKNRGVGESHNVGIKLAAGEYIALLDDDDEFMENKLAEQFTEMAIHNADFSFTNSIKVYEGKKSISKSYPESFIISSTDLLDRKFHLSCSLMMFKSSVKEACIFDPLLMAAVDFDLLARIVHKHKILFINSPLSYIHKSLKHPRISNDPEKKIKSFEHLIKKIKTYCWTEDEKQKAVIFFTLQLGFWLMMDKKYKLGRQSMHGKISYLPFAKRKKYIFLYFLSFCPPLFQLSRKVTEHLWRLSAGRIKI